MRIDLHTHSSASDGTDAPAEVIRRAARAGLDVVALTDHDTQAGLAEAQAALPAGLALVPGMELSCELDGRSVHLLAYLFDPADQALGAETAQVRDDRTYRAKAMTARLAELGTGVTWEQVTAIAGDAVVGRPHLARALVASGAIATTEEAFTDDWIGDGGRAFVGRYAPGLARAVGLVRAAGGVPVLAHPRSPGYEIPYEAIERLAEAGLGGIEVFHFDHDAAERARLTQLATSLDLIMTGGSDDHGSYVPSGALPDDGGHGLGGETTPQEEYERLLALARLSPGDDPRTPGDDPRTPGDDPCTPRGTPPEPPGAGRPGLIAKAAIVSGPPARTEGCGMSARPRARRTTVGQYLAEVRVVEARVERVWSPQVDDQDIGAAEADGHAALGEANAWVVGDDEEVIVIDPGEDADSVLELVGDREILAVICTHGHASHVAAAVDVADRDEAPVALHRSDRLLWRSVHDDLPEIEMADGGLFDVADVQLEVVHTAGHTPGSVSLYCADLGVVFTGDALTANGPVPHEGLFANFPGQLNAIGERLLDLPPQTRVLPGHGEESTIGDAAKLFDGWVAAGPNGELG